MSQRPRYQVCCLLSNTGKARYDFANRLSLLQNRIVLISFTFCLFRYNFAAFAVFIFVLYNVVVVVVKQRLKKAFFFLKKKLRYIDRFK